MNMEADNEIRCKEHDGCSLDETDAVGISTVAPSDGSDGARNE